MTSIITPALLSLSTLTSRKTERGQSRNSAAMSSSSTSCSHWWHAPIYVAAAAALIIAAISTSGELRHHQETDLLLALHGSGFHLTAAALHAPPSTALHVSPSTLFALPDEALSSLSPAAVDDLLRRHVSPLLLPLSSLLRLPRGSPIPTLLPSFNLTLTSNLSINGVPVTRPNLFVSGPHAVHGVAAPFPAVNPTSPTKPNWARAVRALGLKGYVPFAMGLNAILDSLKESSPEQVTVFAPRDSGFDYVAREAYVLERAVRRHVAVGRFLYGQLTGMGIGEGMRTVAGDRWMLMITDGERSGSAVNVNGVEVVDPEIYVGDGIVLHGIAHDFGVELLEF